MSPSLIYLLDIPIYRLNKDAYTDEWKKSPLRKIASNLTNDIKPKMSEFLDNEFDGDWQFNEIIAFLKLHILGAQIRAEYYTSIKKKLVKTRKKIFVLSSYKFSPEIELPLNTDNKNIFASILQYIEDCRDEMKIKHKKAFIDASLLETIGPFIDWKNLVSKIFK